MLKNQSLFLLVFLGYTLFGFGQEYVISYQELSSGSIFHIETNTRKKIGTVIREKKEEGIRFRYLNLMEEVIAEGYTTHQAQYTYVNVYDFDQQMIGGFAAEIHNLYPTNYSVFSKEGTLIANGWMNWLCTNLSLVHADHTQHLLTTYFRPMFKLFNDHWHFNVHEEGAIDFCILAFIGVFQTSCDLKFEK